MLVPGGLLKNACTSKGLTVGTHTAAPSQTGGTVAEAEFTYKARTGKGQDTGSCQVHGTSCEDQEHLSNLLFFSADFWVKYLV